MPIDAWVGCIFLIIITIVSGAFIAFMLDETSSKVLCTIVTIVICIVIIAAPLWYYNSTASGRRAMIDQKSNFENGLDRVITIYTATGDIIAQYEGKIDIEGNDGGYVVFDFEGNRYTYYNCFVESITKID